MFSSCKYIIAQTHMNSLTDCRWAPALTERVQSSSDSTRIRITSTSNRTSTYMFLEATDRHKTSQECFMSILLNTADYKENIVFMHWSQLWHVGLFGFSFTLVESIRNILFLSKRINVNINIHWSVLHFIYLYLYTWISVHLLCQGKVFDNNTRALKMHVFTLLRFLKGRHT